MKSKRSLLTAAMLWFTATAVSFAASAHMGTWKLDESKSKLAPGGGKNTSVTYTQAKDDKVMLKVDGVDKDGKPVHWTWVGRFDGKPYKITGASDVDSMAMKMVNDHVNELTSMKDGKVLITGTVTVAKDGKSRVVKTTMTDASGKKHTDKAYYTKE